MGFRDWKIGTKITVGYLAILLVLATASGYLIMTMRSLAALQNDGFARTQRLDEMLQAEVEVTRLYGIWADAIINRDVAQARRDVARQMSSAQETLGHIDANADTPEEKRMASAIRSSYTRYLEGVSGNLATVERFAEADKAGAANAAELEAAVKGLDDQVDGLRGETITAIGAYVEAHRADAVAGDKEFDTEVQGSIRAAILLALAAAALAVLIGIGAARSITVPIARVVALLQKIAGADLTEAIAVDRKDEVGDILKAASEMSQALRTLIGEIIESVADVADQTQLLAVNAAIEAAKAGEVGRGFGVVASEMKALAEQSKKSAQRIRGIVGEVQRATADTVQLVETGQTRLREALDPVTAILPRVEQLTVQVEESGQSGRQIVAIVAQQGAGIEQISQAMKSIQGGVQEGLAQTQQVERAAESLNALAAKLRDTVAPYRV